MKVCGDGFQSKRWNNPIFGYHVRQSLLMPRGSVCEACSLWSSNCIFQRNRPPRTGDLDGEIDRRVMLRLVERKVR